MPDANVGKMLDDFIAKLPQAGGARDADLSEMIAEAGLLSLPKAGVLAVLADVMLVTCIDCRYSHIIDDYMATVHAGTVYDKLVLAGASLAGNAGRTKRDYWAKTFMEHILISLDLHEIRGVLILDHRTCGAFREFHLLTTQEENTIHEFDVHKEVATEVAYEIAKLFQAKGKNAHIAAFLMPEVQGTGATGLPSPPEPLVSVDV